jgi:hypothetical protein
MADVGGFHTVDKQVRLARFKWVTSFVFSSESGQTANFRLHDEQTVNEEGKSPELPFSV